MFRDYLDVALLFRFGGNVMSDLGTLNGVDNFIVLINQFDNSSLRSTKNLTHA